MSQQGMLKMRKATVWIRQSNHGATPPTCTAAARGLRRPRPLQPPRPAAAAGRPGTAGSGGARCLRAGRGSSGGGLSAGRSNQGNQTARSRLPAPQGPWMSPAALPGAPVLPAAMARRPSCSRKEARLCSPAMPSTCGEARRQGRGVWAAAAPAHCVACQGGSTAVHSRCRPALPPPLAHPLAAAALQLPDGVRGSVGFYVRVNHGCKQGSGEQKSVATQIAGGVGWAGRGSHRSVAMPCLR